MAESNVSSVPFFPTAASSRLSNSRNQTEAKNKPNAEFKQSLSTALSSDSSRPKAVISKSVPTRLDKPKFGNREPFFPATPMPYHPDSTSTYADLDPEQTEEVRFNDRPMLESRMKLNNGEIEDSDGLKVTPVSLQQQEDGEETKFDDHVGAMKESYSGTVVSYPVRRIASESLDDQAENDLKAKGLWDVPTIMAAVPTPKTMAMAQIVESQSLENSANAKAVPVQRPIAQFMASLESELGVSHDRLVRAFQTLPPGSLSQSPRETMTDVVKNLNLVGEDETKAMQIYSKMLSQMETLDQKDQVPVAAPQVATNQAKVASGKYAAQSAGVVTKGAGLEKIAEKVTEKETGTEVKTKEIPPVVSVKEAVVAKVPVQGGQAPIQQAPTQVAPHQQGQLSQNQSQQQMPQQDSSQQEAPQQQPQFQGAFVKPGQEAKFKAVSSEVLKVQTREPSKPSSSQVALVNTTSASGADQVSLPQDVKNLGLAGGVIGQSVNEKSTAHVDSRQEAIQAIVNNARLLAQKGGGEMHMTLKPEHLGEIQLRVSMVGQKLDVQMTTERSDVKKLIEQSVHELKHGLASHNLNMEKMDVSLNSKNPGEFHQPTRDFSQARDFAQQFHQQNQARRDLAEMEMPGGINLNRGLSSRAESASKLMASERPSSRLHVVA